MRIEKKWILWFLLVLFVVTLIRTAWVSDDAYVTFRVVDNFVNGYGLRWNTFERVQVYTNPLWMFFMSLFYFFTREIYYTSIFVGIVVSTAAVLLMVKNARNLNLAIAGVFALLFSKAFTDYSTSGLENPLTFLLIAMFFWVYVKKKGVLWLTLIASLGMVNRLDNALLFVPLVVYAAWKLGNKKSTWKDVGLGLLPIIIWEMFSLLYYGFLLPNTYYAKLNTGIPLSTSIIDGVWYLLNSIKLDPITLTIILFAAVMLYLGKKREYILGLVLPLLYILYIGGDFMSGRFLAAPLFYAVCAMTQLKFGKKEWITLWGVMITCIIFSASIPLLSGIDYENKAYDHWIADERGWYYQETGLLKGYGYPKHEWAERGIKVKAEREIGLLFWDTIGFMGYYAGPGHAIIDVYGIGDPLLARMPALDEKHRVGHYKRQVPQGYFTLLAERRDIFEDRNLFEYQVKLRIITQWNIFNPERLWNIVKMNLGFYDELIDREYYSQKHTFDENILANV